MLVLTEDVVSSVTTSTYFPVQKLSEYLEGLKCKFDSILAISPTGWTHSNKTVGLDKIRPKLRRGSITVYGKTITNIRNVII